MSIDKPPSAAATYVIVALSSLFFCSKGVFAKSAYALGATPIETLALRMGLALPFFIVIGIAASWKAPALGARRWAQLGALGFMGYYLSSLVNFIGLSHITIGLERIVLYTYPSLVLLGAMLFKKKRIGRPVIIGMLISYAGIVVAFAGEAGGRGGGSSTALGVALVFASALSYAAFITLSGDLLQRTGPARFTSIVVGFSCVLILVHYGLTQPLNGLARLPTAVWGYGALLAICGTVLPSLLLGYGLRRAGATKFAVIGTIGPVATFLLAWAILNEVPNVAQLCGFGLALCGGLLVALKK